jgi:hypothetical protein
MRLISWTLRSGSEQEPPHSPAIKVLGRRHDSNLPDENGAALNGTELDRSEDTEKDVKEVGKSILVRILYSTEAGNRTKLDNSGNFGNL